MPARAIAAARAPSGASLGLESRRSRAVLHARDAIVESRSRWRFVRSELTEVIVFLPCLIYALWPFRRR